LGGEKLAKNSFFIILQILTWLNQQIKSAPLGKNPWGLLFLPKYEEKRK